MIIYLPSNTERGLLFSEKDEPNYRKTEGGARNCDLSLLLMATRNPANSPVEVGSWNPIIYKALAPSQVGFRRISSIKSSGKGQTMWCSVFRYPFNPHNPSNTCRRGPGAEGNINYFCWFRFLSNFQCSLILWNHHLVLFLVQQKLFRQKEQAQLLNHQCFFPKQASSQVDTNVRYLIHYGCII